ncbi:hypothetical protein V5O48_014515 [Marasmius crinis-equi]|uniref:Uncharacterized protein n=1 Tax=Marasmius crinis-equi TaxID=585013 RepID=A0ABR3EX29_9AGAR
MNRYSGSSAPTTHTTSSVTSRGSMGSIGSRSGWSSGLSLVQGNDSAYGDYTGTKGFGTGNTFERAERPNAIPGVYGGSTGTKGFGTGNSFEDKRLRSSRSMASLQIPTRSSRPSDASSVRSRRSVGFGERVREIAGKVSSIAVPERELHAEPRSISVRA